MVRGILRSPAVASLAVAVALVFYGLLDLSHTTNGDEYVDTRRMLFDNGVYPFLWGVSFLVIGQLTRWWGYCPVVRISSLAALAWLVTLRLTTPALVPDSGVFPSLRLLDELLVLSAGWLLLTMADGYIQRAIAAIGHLFRHRS
ncbi:hypothetical protein [Burkholderia cepacia]|uniref:hypothetical protein n=1 Tax=Burkholderia cepacia TaxID=292 RepID=UPI00158EDA6C|nr:hypothetical protein [Burkholderia cepacia]